MRSIFFLILFSCVIVGQAQDKWSFGGVNSEFDEQNPVLSPDGNSVYFIRANHPANTGQKKDKGDIWMSTWSDSSWSVPINVGKPLNNLGFNGVIGFLGDGGMLLYGNYSKTGASTHGRGLSISYKTKNGWSNPIEFNIEYYYNAAEHNGVSISRDQRILMLSLESYGTIGGEDIYVSFRSPAGGWSQPLNLGSDINTRYQEMTPVLAPDNKTLFFASNGWEGFGSRDIYVAKRLDDTWKHWTKPANLGTKVNTVGKELQFFFVDENTALYTSTVNSDGYGDIKSVRFSQEEADSLNAREIADQIEIVDLQEVKEIPVEAKGVVYGVVRDATTGEFINAAISAISNSEIKLKYNVEEEGRYSLELAPENYQIIVQAPGYISREELLSITDSGLVAVEVDFNLYPIEVGRTIKFDHVNFRRSTADLLESSYSELDLVVKMMQENPDLEIMLSGHTDNQGSSKLNLKLSQERVDMVTSYLVGHSISEKRITGKGYGGTRPIASNYSEETRKLNRRVEFTILKK